ncbi:hypothetical protein [Paenibacillus kandeliae]|uniref:hypothetical protein n=1 Tax=Paenibacillus kandeliae TaxID=3231269 RepID=UPI003457473F
MSIHTTPDERLFEAIGQVDDALLERLEAHMQAHSQPLTARSRSISRQRKRWGGIAAVLVATVAACIFIFNSIGQQLPSMYTASGTVIDSYTSDTLPPSSSVSPSMAAPQNGMLSLDNDLKLALNEHAQQSVTYFVAVDLYSNGSLLTVDSKQARSEVERLQQAHYKVGYSQSWTYRGNMQKVYQTYIAGYFTAEQLKQFAASPDYGYSLHFIFNGDGSPVSPDNGIFTQWDDSGLQQPAT